MTKPTGHIPPHKQLSRLQRRIHRKTRRTDRPALLRDVNKLRKRSAADSQVKDLGPDLKTLSAKIDRSETLLKKRIRSVPPIQLPPELPISAHRDEIVAAIRNHAVVIVAGETGSGKSTQLPKLCLAADRGIQGLIASTQPRRIAAVNIARRIAEEMDQPLGQAVGYKVRFAEETAADGYIQVMTDGMLLSETQSDRRLWRYDTIIIDEAHERSLNIDFLIGYIKGLQTQRRDLKLIITSATIDIEKFQRAFDQAPVIEVSGRLYPVEQRYWIDDHSPQTEELSYVEMAVEAVARICDTTANGDILIFMPGEQDIRDTIEILTGRLSHRPLLLPLFARLPAGQQQQIFATSPRRKIIVSTNVAETSLTVPGIRYVVDSGLARIARYSPRTRTKSLAIAPISRASADQRAGRCGRTADGICIRLYSQANYDQRPPFTAPEIRRTNLAEVILRMLALNLGGPESFDFIDPPDVRALQDGRRLLTELGALHPMVPGKKASLTTMGRQMAALPVGPRTARMLIEAQRRGCLPDVLVIAAALGIPDPRERPFEATQKARQQHRQFDDPLSDFVALLNIWKKFKTSRGAGKFAGPLRRLCQTDFLSFRRMREWADIHGQLKRMIAESDMGTKTQGPSPQKTAPSQKKKESPFSDRYKAMHCAILSGFLSNVAVQKEKNIYQATRAREVMLFPGSGLFNQGGKWIVAAEIMETKRLYARLVAAIDSDWLVAVGGKVCRYTYLDPHWAKARGKVVATEQVTLMGLIVSADRKVPFGPVESAAATEIFVREALIPGSLKGKWPFLEHNLALVNKGRDIEDRIRRRDLVAEESAQYDFYTERLPKTVYDIPSLKKVLREQGSDRFLKMTEQDLFLYQPQTTIEELFPDKVQFGQARIKCDYSFEPGHQKDGLTVRIPAPMAQQIAPQELEWLVPGMLAEKAAALIKTLPKSLRRPLLPVSRTLERILPGLRVAPHNQSFGQALSHIIRDTTGIHIPPGEWRPDQLPDHLKTRIALTDASGAEIAADRNLAILHNQTPIHDTACPDDLWQDACRKWQKEGLRRWTCGELPLHIDIRSSTDFTWQAYPALTKRNSLLKFDPVDMRLYPSSREAHGHHPHGVAALTAIGLSSEIQFLQKHLRLPRVAPLLRSHWHDQQDLKSTLLEGFLSQHLTRNIRHQADFDRHLATLKPGFMTLGRNYLKNAVALLETFSDATRHLEKLRLRVLGQPALFAHIETLTQHLWQLVPRNFSALYSRERLAHVSRYIQALQIRADRGIENLDKEHQKSAQVAPFESFLSAQAQALTPGSSAQKRQAVEDFFWLLEEFKVSVFAQELGTAQKVSAKRLKQAMQHLQTLT